MLPIMAHLRRDRIIGDATASVPTGPRLRS
jgi:hypothetical protein